MRSAFLLCLALLGAGSLATSAPAQEGSVSQPAADTPFEQAERYHHGLGVVQNFQTAAEWYQQAAEQGDARAQNRLGQYYHSGLGVDRDPEQALIWLEKAAQQQDPEFMFDLAKVLENSDPARAALLHQKAAEAGHQEAAVHLGVLYQGGIGVEQDYERAYALYRGPAEAGHARAQNNLGLLYVRGHGIAQDYERATALFQAAAEQGLPTAMTNLSVMYANGLGIEQSDALAAEWELKASQTRQDAISVTDGDAELCLFDDRLKRPENTPENLAALTRATDAGDPVALFLTAWLICNRTDATIADLRESIRLFRAAADRGHSPSMFNLAQFYIRGRGVPQDFVLGYMWLTLASSTGLPQSFDQNAALRQRMTPDQVNEAQNRAAEIWQHQRAL